MPEEARPVRVVMRHYFSSYLLWTAQHLSELAGEIERHHQGQSRFDVEHRAYVLGSVQAAQGFLEGMVNELFQDAHDGHGTTGDGYLAPLSRQAQERMRLVWESTGQGFLAPLEKYQVLLASVGLARLDTGAQPFQDAAILVKLRNALVHYRPESVAADDAHLLERQLRSRFPENRLMEESGNPWWPSHCLGYGCAEWAHRTAKALADRVVDQIGVRPNYRRNEQGDWFGRPPGPEGAST